MSSAVYREVHCDTVEEAKQRIASHGVAVLRSGIPEAEIPALRDSMWSTFEHLTSDMGKQRILRCDPSTYTNITALYPMHSMLLQHHGLGHAQYVWDVRTHPSIVAAFSSLWGTEDLITSFDGVSLHMPHEVTKKGYFRNEWFHVDQRSSRRGLESIQGLVNLYDVNPGDATLCVLEKSNTLFGEYFDHYGIDTKTADWYKIHKDDAREHVAWFESKGCTKTCVLAKAGELVLWDSKTMHFGKEAVRGRSKPNFRSVVYVCMTPRSRASSTVLGKRKQWFEDGRMCTHLPHNPKVFPRKPRTYGGPEPKVHPLPRPKATEAVMKLV